MNTQEARRQYERGDLHGRAFLFFGKDSEVSETFQISEGGMLAATSLRLEIGDKLTVHFSVEGQFLRARAQVIYMMLPDEEGRSRIGLRFHALYEEYRSAIRAYIR